jgi:hypothetical protein
MTLGPIPTDSLLQKVRGFGLIDYFKAALVVKRGEMIKWNAVALTARKGVHERAQQSHTDSLPLTTRIDLHSPKHQDPFLTCSPNQADCSSVQSRNIYDIRWGDSAVIPPCQIKLV